MALPNRIADLDLKDKRVLIRVDFNVPLKEVEGVRVVSDDTRIRSAVPTIELALKAGAKVILASHMGRPKGERVGKYSLRPTAEHLAKLLDRKVDFSEQTIGSEVETLVENMHAGDVLVIENTRYDARERKNDADFAQGLADLADVFINDAFGSAHRAHASTTGVAHLVPQTGVGLLLERELDYLGGKLTEPETPYVAIIGGAKVSDKISVIDALLDRVDKLLIGGGMSYTFLSMLGHKVGNSLFEEDKLEEAKRLYETAAGRLILPVDHIVADAFSNDANIKVVEGDIEDGWMGLDIGPKSIELYKSHLADAKTVIWNGPMGVFEMTNFAKGTLAVANSLADITKSGAITVVGGGDSVAAISAAELDDDVSHVSTGGGAMLEFLEGKVLPGVAALALDN